MPDLLYRKFRRGLVYVSDSIGQSIYIVQNGQTIEGAKTQANFHLEESGDGLRFYLPKDELDLEVCFERHLPRRLCQYMGINDTVAKGVIGAVFRKNNPAVIDRILDDAGVGQVECDLAALDAESAIENDDSTAETINELTRNLRLSTSLDAEPVEGEDDLNVETLIGLTRDVRLSARNPEPRPWRPSERPRQPEGGRYSGVADVLNGPVPNTTTFPAAEQLATTQEAAYKKVLENVVNVARQGVQSGVFEATGLRAGGLVPVHALSREIINEAFGARTKDRDFKLGAAGELYMFEYLKGLGLYDFSLRDWQSSIRNHVSIHSDYAGLEKSDGRAAIADIEYFDLGRELTNFLIGTGHLRQELWENATPYYHIEVKTTTSSNWQEPFFVSKYQERHVSVTILLAFNC